MKVLITGGLGYIGSHTVTVFANAGYELIIIDNFSNSHENTLNTLQELCPTILEFYNIDLRKEVEIEQFFAEKGKEIGLVIHFAAKKAVGESCADPFGYYENNVNGTINLLKAMEKSGVKNLIFSSSACVYDTERGIPPFDEESLLKTINPYGTTKLIIEEILQDLSQHKDFHVIALRYFNPVGCHSSHRIGENPKDTPTNLLPYLLKVAKGELLKLNIFGDDYDTPDGTCIRDYIHVMDVAEAHLVAGQYLTQMSGFEAINVGTGRGTSVKEMLELAEEVIGKAISHEIVGRREGDSAISLAKVEKAKKMLGWEAKRTIKEAVEDAWEYVSTF